MSKPIGVAATILSLLPSGQRWLWDILISEMLRLGVGVEMYILESIKHSNSLKRSLIFKFTFKYHFMDDLSINLPHLHPEKFKFLWRTLGLSEDQAEAWDSCTPRSWRYSTEGQWQATFSVWHVHKPFGGDIHYFTSCRVTWNEKMECAHAPTLLGGYCFPSQSLQEITG